MRSALFAALILVTAACTAAPDTDASTTASDVTTTSSSPSEPEDTYREERLAMVAKYIEGRGVSDPVVLEAMRTTPRHRFVTDDWLSSAYENHPLPIGYGQTISQPYIVGLMSEALQLEPGDRVLEIGTGSGYQAAVLADMGMQVFTIEIIPQLAERAATALADSGYTSVTARQGDGYFGWPEEGPFDAIIVTAAPDHLPQPLVGQLAEGGHLVVPVGPVGAVQTLWQFTADEDGELVAVNLGPVRFVPLTREQPG